MAHLDCAYYTNIGTPERIAIYVAAMIYHALFHRMSCDEDRSFEFRVSFQDIYAESVCRNTE